MKIFCSAFENLYDVLKRNCCNKRQDKNFNFNVDIFIYLNNIKKLSVKNVAGSVLCA